MKSLSADARVLEIGAGSNPWVRSDVLVERYAEDTTGQRDGATLHTDRRPLVIAAGEHLPFTDDSFDYLYCNHVIEHAEDIGRMLDEFSRVAKAGWIECPNPLLERLHNLPTHNWLVARKEDGLLIAAKASAPTLGDNGDRTCFALIGKHRLAQRYWDRFVTRLEWQDRIDYVITEDVDALFAALPFDPEFDRQVEQNITRTLFGAIRSIYRDRLSAAVRALLGKLRLFSPLKKLKNAIRQSRGQRPVINLDEILCCPYCKGELNRSPDQYTCRDCARSYPVQDGLPTFL